MRACETSRDVEPHKQVGLSPLVASRRPLGAERNGLAWKPVAEDHRTGVEGTEGVMSLWKRAHGAQRGGATRVEPEVGPAAWRPPRKHEVYRGPEQGPGGVEGPWRRELGA